VDTDRNLLFGVLALQAGLIGRDQFVQACTLWAARKQTPLAEVLVEQGWLDPAGRSAVEQLLGCNLARHEGDARAGLAVVSTPDIRQALTVLDDPEVRGSLALSPADQPTRLSECGAPAEGNGAADQPFPRDAAGHNLLYEEIGRGGMGAVRRGRDPRLGRDLAVKVLLESHRANPALVERFLEEARIGGQLQHPGVVPVYELGRFPDERPFFTMKLVKGRTLADLLKERDEPQQDLPRFLAVFEQVCQCLAYAHSHGVIHRDLKPANVMVGAFGEVQVMDWGLAKVLPRAAGESPPAPSDEHGPTLIRTARAGSPAETAAGAVVGTPAFMPPEQAHGQVDRMDERADVFGLGGILCVILTGRPPYTGGRDEVLRRARDGDLADAHARLAFCGADAELVQLCRDCLAAERDQRPRDAGQVAARVADYQRGVQERLRRAELERAAAQAKAAGERRRRQLTLALAVSLLALTAAGAGAWMYLDRQAWERRTGVEAALDKVAELQGQARWAEALAVLEQARDRLGASGPADLRRRLEQAGTDLDVVDRLDAIRLKRAMWVEGQFDNRTADRDYEEVFRGQGLEPGGDAGAAAAAVRGSAVREQLVAALDDWALAVEDQDRRLGWVLAVARGADPGPWRDRVRDPAVWGRAEALARLARDARLADLSPALVSLLGRRLRKAGGDAVPLLREARRLRPDDFWLNFWLGNALLAAKEPAEALGYYRAAQALRPGAVVLHNNVGLALDAQGRRDEAVAEFRRAFALDPKDALPHYNLGNTLRALGRAEEALAEYRRAVELDPTMALAHNNLGNVLKEKGRLAEALAEYRRAALLDPRIAGVHHNLGNLLRQMGQAEGAPAEYRRAVTLDPKNAQIRYDFGSALWDQGLRDEALAEFQQAVALDPEHAQAHNSLGVALWAKGRRDEAIAAYRRATELNPKDATAHHNLGMALSEEGRLEEAENSFRAVLALNPKHVQAHYNLGMILYGAGRREEGVAEFRKVVDLDPTFAPAHNAVGWTLYENGDMDGAVAAFRRALDLDPRFVQAHTNLGLALASKGLADEAVAEYRRAIDLDPKAPKAPYGLLGFALLQQGRFAEAREAFRHGLDLLPAKDRSQSWLTRQLRQAEKFLALEKKLPTVLRGERAPADAAECLDLAELCLDKRLYAACRFYAAVIDTRPEPMQNARRYDAARAAALAAAGRGDDAGTTDARERALFRRQALTWLRAELDLVARLAGGGDRADALVRQTLKRWQADTDLAGLRDPAALARLPQAEREACRRFWDDVAGLLDRLEKQKG
jgi:serine/threonine-protein kinase